MSAFIFKHYSCASLWCCVEWRVYYKLWSSMFISEKEICHTGQRYTSYDHCRWSRLLQFLLH